MARCYLSLLDLWSIFLHGFPGYKILVSTILAFVSKFPKRKMAGMTGQDWLPLENQEEAILHQLWDES